MDSQALWLEDCRVQKIINHKMGLVTADLFTPSSYLPMKYDVIITPGSAVPLSN